MSGAKGCHHLWYVLLKWSKYRWQKCVCVHMYAYTCHKLLIGIFLMVDMQDGPCRNAWAALAIYVTVLHSSCSVLLLVRIIRLQTPGK